jgi:diguanylate cyclase (GGDEF)-like protein
MTFPEIFEAIELAQQRIRVLQQELTAFFSAIPDPIFIVNREGILLEVLGGNDRKFYNNLEYMKDQPISELFSEALSDQAMAVINACFDCRQVQIIEFELNPQDILENPYDITETRWYEARVAPVKDDQGEVIAATWSVINITEKKHLEFQLKEAAQTDPLTGLFNRRYLTTAIHKEFANFKRYQTSISCILLDVDHFKSINDNYGHDIGDIVLKRLADTISSLLREGDVFARYGGEEFMVLLPNTELHSAFHIAQRLRETVSKEKVTVEQMNISFTISLGVANAQAFDSHAEDVIKRADQALYQSKAEGRNRVSLARADEL